jgi:hypothetical protein
MALVSVGDLTSTLTSFGAFGDVSVVVVKNRFAFTLKNQNCEATFNTGDVIMNKYNFDVIDNNFSKLNC